MLRKDVCSTLCGCVSECLCLYSGGIHVLVWVHGCGGGVSDKCITISHIYILFNVLVVLYQLYRIDKIV